MLCNADVRPWGSFLHQFIWLPFHYSLSVTVVFVHFCGVKFTDSLPSLLFEWNSFAKEREETRNKQS